MYCLIAGSSYFGSTSFDVTKTRLKDPETVSEPSSDATTDAISVTIPRELRGNSEILIFLSPEPVRGTPEQ